MNRRSIGPWPSELAVRVWNWVLAVLLFAGFAAQAAVPPAQPLPSDYVLIVTGDELLQGSISDAHTPFIARTLRPLGLRCVRVILVDDTEEALQSALREGARQANLVFTTGGLGPTVNDRTREVLSAFTGVPLQESELVLTTLSQRFSQSSDQLRDNLRRQALVPKGGHFLPNDQGTAVGLIFITDPTVFIALPGPPRELRPMVSTHLAPWLRTRLGLPERGVSVTLRFVGVGQSAIDVVLRRDIALPPELVTTSTFEGSRVDFTFSLPENSPEGRRRLAELASAINEHLGRYLYATNSVSLEEVAWARLSRSSDSLMLVEAAGPHLGSAFARANLPETARITSLAGSSESDLRDLLDLDGEAWKSIAEPADRVRTLGLAARRWASAGWVLVLGAPCPSEESRGTVWVALGYPEGSWDTWRLTVRESPETGWPGVVNTVLDRLRRIEVQPSSQRMPNPSTIR